MKKFLVAALMLVCLGTFAGEVVVQGETLGKPIRNKREYSLKKGNLYVKTVNEDMFLSCKEVDGKISEIIVTFDKMPSYADAVSFTLKMMASYASKYNKGVYFALGESFFVTRYNGNNIVTASFDSLTNGNWIVHFTFEKLSEKGIGYIKYEKESN